MVPHHLVSGPHTPVTRLRAPPPILFHNALMTCSSSTSNTLPLFSHLANSSFSFQTKLLFPSQGNQSSRLPSQPSHGPTTGLQSFFCHCRSGHSALSFPLGGPASLSILGTPHIPWHKGPGFESLLLTNCGTLVRLLCLLVSQCPQL